MDQSELGWRARGKTSLAGKHWSASVLEIQRSCYLILALNSLCTLHRTCTKHVQPLKYSISARQVGCELSVWFLHGEASSCRAV